MPIARRREPAPGEFCVRELAPAATRAIRRAILRPHESIAAMAAAEAPGAFAVGAFAGGELISVGLVAQDGGEDAWRVRGMATLAHARGRGAGSAVLRALVEHALAHGASRVWCNARVPARSLYERAGFRVISEPFELPHIGPHVVMELSPPRTASGRRRDRPT